MTTRCFAIDTHFYTNQGVYDWEVRLEMLEDLGYDAIYISLGGVEREYVWADLPEMGDRAAAHGLTVAGVQCAVDLVSKTEDHARLLEAVPSLPRGATVEVALNSSDWANFDYKSEAAADCLGGLLDASSSNELPVLLYHHVGLAPHVNVWLQRVDQAVALARHIGHPRLGVVFSGYHWYTADGAELPARLKEAAPYLRSVNLCGSRAVPAGDKVRYTLETLDSVGLDNFAILGQLRQIGYTGSIGFQGFSVGGDVYTQLRRNLETFRDMERRLDEHPGWASLQWT